MREKWRYVLIVNGRQYVVMDGQIITHKLFAEALDLMTLPAVGFVVLSYSPLLHNCCVLLLDYGTLGRVLEATGPILQDHYMCNGSETGVWPMCTNYTSTNPCNNGIRVTCQNG